MKDIVKTYEQFDYLVFDVYQECLEGGYEKGGAAGKVKYELEPMATTQEEKVLLYFSLSYQFAMENLKESFEDVYNKLKMASGTENPFQLIEESQALNKIYKFALTGRKDIILDFARG